jgi:hypothetical protein
MKAKFYLVSLLLGGLVIFVWGAFSHMALPWWNDVMREIPNEQALADVMRTNGMENGMYYGMQGLFLVKFFGKGMSDGISMGPLMLMEFISDLLVALVLTWLLVRANTRGTLRLALYAAAVGLAGWLTTNVSNWIWYNFSFGYIILEALDQIIGVFLAGLVIGKLIKRERTTVTLDTSRVRVVG